MGKVQRKVLRAGPTRRSAAMIPNVGEKGLWESARSHEQLREERISSLMTAHAFWRSVRHLHDIKGGSHDVNVNRESKQIALA